MKRMTWMVLCIAGIMAGCDKDDDDRSEEVNQTDRDFTVMSAMSNTAESGAGQLASSKGADAGIREFGQHMVAEHTSSQSNLKALAMDLGLRAPDSLDAEHAALKSQLESMSGRTFDSMYIHSQVTDHQRAIALFENQVNSGQNQRLKDFARDQLPHLNEHLAMADSLAQGY